MSNPWSHIAVELSGKAYSGAFRVEGELITVHWVESKPSKDSADRTAMGDLTKVLLREVIARHSTESAS